MMFLFPARESSSRSTTALDLTRHLTTDIDCALRFEATERLPHPGVAPARLGGQVQPPGLLEDVLEFVRDELDGVADRRNGHHCDNDASGIQSHTRRSPTLRIRGLAPHKHDDGMRVGELATLVTERRRPFPGFLNDAEQGWLDDESTGPRRNSRWC